MTDLLKTLTIDQIILYIVILAIATKEVVGFISWCKTQYNQKFNKDFTKKKSEELIEEHYQESIKLYQTLDEKIDNINTKVEEIEEKISEVSDSTDKLSSSTMHDIKGWIVEKHHQLIKDKWVDDFTMDTLEKRYQDYVDLGGNSYVGGLMTEIRQLPHGIQQ